jgi:hypothetical protein
MVQSRADSVASSARSQMASFVSAMFALPPSKRLGLSYRTSIAIEWSVEGGMKVPEVVETMEGEGGGWLVQVGLKVLRLRRPLEMK